MAAAFSLTCVGAAIALYDRSHPVGIASPSQVLLDTRLVWTTHSISPVWTPVPGPQDVYVWDRRVPTYTLIDRARPDERWTNVELTPSPSVEVAGISLWEINDCFPPIFDDGRFYTASRSPEHKLFAHDLRQPPVSVTRNIGGYPWTELQRPPAWEHELPRGSDVSGMTFDNGKLYVGVENTLGDSGSVMVFNAADGRSSGSASFPRGQVGSAVLVGPPVLGRLASGEVVVVAALCCRDGSGAVCAMDAAAGGVLWTSILEFHPIGPAAVGGGVVVVGGIGPDHRQGFGWAAGSRYGDLNRRTMNRMPTTDGNRAPSRFPTQAGGNLAASPSIRSPVPSQSPVSRAVHACMR